jgi:putative redox protein
MVPKKQGIDVTDLVIDGDVVRAEEMPQKFDALHLDYNFNSSADDDTAARWVMASIETYCSTLNTIRGVTKITYSITHNGKKIRDKAEIISGETATDFGSLEGCCPS